VNLLIYEHFSAGGFRKEESASSVLSEGFGMLRTAIKEASNAGHSVRTILDGQIAEFNPPLDADRKITATSLLDAENSLFEIAGNCDATYIIAPATDDKLQKLVQRMQHNKSLCLTSTARAIADASNKALLHKKVGKLGLKSPKTIAFAPTNDPNAAVEAVSNQLGFPAILKPAKSDGCEALRIVENEEQTRNVIARFSNFEGHSFIAQEFVQGIAASVSLITNGTKAWPITLNRQNISLNSLSRDSTYNGGITPFNHKLITSAFAAAKSVTESIEGLQGYVGVDVVLTKTGPVVIEINPRLTTSYIGISRILRINLMQAIVDSILKRELPRNQELNGYAKFGKIKVAGPNISIFQRTLRIPEVVSPPFPLKNRKSTYSLICAKDSTEKKAKLKFNKAKKRLQTISKYGG